MTRRSLPQFQPFKPIRAPHLNRLSAEIGRVTGLPTSGEPYVDNSCGRFYPPKKVTTGSGLIPFIVTEQNGSLPVAVYRTYAEGDGFYGKKVDSDLLATGDDILVKTGMMRGVICTGEVFWAVRFRSQWYAAVEGDDFWTTGVTNEAIDADGTGLVELYVDGPLITATSRTGVPISTSVDVEFDEREQVFACTAQDCPPAV